MNASSRGQGSARKNASGRGGSRPAGRSAEAAGRPGAGRTRERGMPEGVRVTGARPVPFERNRALRILGGLFLFTLGFAIAGALVVAGMAATVPYFVGLGIGIVGLGITGFGMMRGTTPMPEPAIWTRHTLSLLADAAGLPAFAVMAVLYTLGLLGILGNILDPVVFGAR